MTICFMKYANIYIKRSEEIKLGTLLFFHLSSNTFTSRIQNQPSTCIHERPGIEMKQKKIQAIIVSSDSSCSYKKC